MSEINGSEYKESRFPAGEVVWSALGIIVVLAFGDLFVLLALAAAVVIMATAWWTYRSTAYRGQNTSDADLASVTQLRAVPAVQHDLRWHGPSAA
jgi:ABC-type protease/lipase transport system fused ATPase/permease subunit